MPPRKKKSAATGRRSARSAPPVPSEVAPDARLAGLSRHDFYEACVQSPEDAVPLLRAIHGGDPAVLGEDFAGTAALSRAWVLADPDARAIAVELDAGTLEEARRRASSSVPASSSTAIARASGSASTQARERAAVPAKSSPRTAGSPPWIARSRGTASSGDCTHAS